ncbi:hypothetical protein PF008_g10223 [Phytophthora fragariae]|uniref:Uncharacterized protein n=1 Tax=Phytophthora fragariae TaxID=53985 RepID=A0A6G0RU88_9STRA|nr:hypothetical protein PF008_g10223 [Phytophthora fragariae]
MIYTIDQLEVTHWSTEGLVGISGRRRKVVVDRRAGWCWSTNAAARTHDIERAGALNRVQHRQCAARRLFGGWCVRALLNKTSGFDVDLPVVQRPTPAGVYVALPSNCTCSAR